MILKINDANGISKSEIADRLRKAANQISPLKLESTGSKRFPIPAGKQIFEYFDGKFRDMMAELKKEIEKI